VQLAVVQADGAKPIIIASNTHNCKTYSPGPAPFTVPLRVNDQLTLRNQRLRVSINLLDARLDLPFLFWDSPNMGSTKLSVPTTGSTLMKMNSESRNLMPDTKILEND
jgi:hypothetical protein